MKTTFKGIDVSEHQDIINWSAVKNQIDFAIIRAGYGRNHIDKQFKRNIEECNRLCIPCGVYWFSYAVTADEAKKEAQYCLEAIKPYKVEYPVCFDFEYDSVRYAESKGVRVTKELASAMCNAFLGEIEKAGYYAVNYANPDFFNRYFDTEIPKRWDVWLAEWKNPDNGKPSRACGIWQWGASPISGINGNVDSNIAYKDYVKLIRDYKLNHLDKPVEVVSEYDRAVKKIESAGGKDVIIGIADLIGGTK